MKKRMMIMLLSVAVLFGSIFGYKILMGILFKRYLQSQVPKVTVSAIQAAYSLWQPLITVSGSMRAVRGVNVTTELAGLVQTIYFTPGAFVSSDTLLVQLDADAEIARLHSLQANAELARVTYLRDKELLAKHAVSQAVVDTDTANLLSQRAQVREQMATLAKKTIRAPFTGRLGINYVNPGQFINPGDRIVNLQALDPLYADFYVPQQELSRIKVGNHVTISADTFPNKRFSGLVTTINPAVNEDSRNVAAEATIANPLYELAPGMFVSVSVSVGKPKWYLTLPQAAISFNPYGEMVFVLHQHGKDVDRQPILIANQVFVQTGDTRGDQIAVLSGLRPGDLVVTSGQLKLKNGSRVLIDNSVAPANNPAPKVQEEE